MLDSLYDMSNMAYYESFLQIMIYDRTRSDSTLVLVYKFSHNCISLMFCSDAGIPISSAGTEDKLARVNIAASFQRVAVLHLEENCERAI